MTGSDSRPPNARVAEGSDIAAPASAREPAPQSASAREPAPQSASAREPEPQSASAREPEPASARAWRLALLASAALVLLFHFRLALPGRALVANDFRALFIALRLGLQQTLRHGELPLWQRGMFLGYPILGDIQPQLFNPLTWLTLPLEAARGLTVQSLAELCLCAAGMAFWMKQRGLRPLEGVFAAVAFALCLKETVHLHHWTFASSTCAWPWMLAGLDGFARTRSRRFLALTAAATCGTWIGASPQMAWFGSALACAYALALWPQLGARDSLRALACVPLGFALAAPLLWPVAELSALGPRGAGITYKFAGSWSWPDRSAWAAMILPRAWGGRPHFTGPMNYWELQGYFGLLPMALALAAPLWKRRGLWVFAAVALLSVWLSWGENSWLGLHRLAVRVLPGYGGFRNPTRALLPAMFCVAVLAAEGLARLRALDSRAQRRVLAGLAACAAAVAFYVAAPPARASPAELRQDALCAAVLLALSALWAAFGRRRAAFLVVPLLLADLAFQTWDSPEIGDAASEGRALEALAPLVPQAPAPRRLTVMLDWGEANNATYARGWEGVTGYGPLPLQRVLTLEDATWSGRLKPPLPLDDDPNFPRVNPGSDLAPLFGSALLAVNRDLGAPPLASAGEVRVYRTPALPRVYWTQAWEAADDAHVEGPLHRAARGDVAVLAEPLDQPSGPPRGPVAARDLAVGTNWLRATLDAPADGVAVILDPWFPGWHARLDGRPVPLVRANFAFEAVAVKAGVHTLELSYFPDRLLQGCAAAAAAAIALFVLLRNGAMRRVDTPGTRGYFPPP